MSLETETKKIAINLQQLTDAIVTLTAALKANKPAVAELSSTLPKLGLAELPAEESIVATTTEVVVNTPETPIITGMAADVVVVDDVVVDIHAVTGMTMEQANLELQTIVGQLGDGGVSVRDLLKQHNAISLAQIAPEKYEAFVTEARGLLTAKQA